MLSFLELTFSLSIVSAATFVPPQTDRNDNGGSNGNSITVTVTNGNNANSNSGSIISSNGGSFSNSNGGSITVTTSNNANSNAGSITDINGNNANSNSINNMGTDRNDDTGSGTYITNGIEERQPCVSWSSISDRQKQMQAAHHSKDCHNDAGYPYTSGCCRSHTFLVIDTPGRLYPQFPCICNQFTRDPRTFYSATTINPNPGTSNTYPTDTIDVITSPDTMIDSTPAVNVQPLPAVPATAQPVPSPTTMEPALQAATTPQPGSGSVASRWTLNSCANQSNRPFWTDPAYANQRKCFFSDECKNIPNSCCLAETCLCGVYNSKSEECIPMIDGPNDRQDPPLSAATAVEENAAEENVCLRPENQKLWDNPAYTNRQKCTSSKQCRNTQSSCCLKPFCLCGLVRPEMVNDLCLPDY